MMKLSRSQAMGWMISLTGFFAEWLVFLLLALATTRPLTDSRAVTIPQGMEPVATVPLFNLWTMGWNISRLEAGLQNYWEAPIFHPAHDAFAFSEPQPLMMLMAPIVWCGGTLAMAYNTYLWLGLSLTGLVTSRFLHGLTRSWFAAWSGGAMMVLLPYVHWQLGVIQLVPLFGVIWTIQALTKFGEEPGIKRSLLLGTAFAMTYFLCNYHGLFLSLLLILSGGWLLGKQLWNWRMWGKLLPGAAWCLLLIGPMIVHQREVSAQYDWERPEDLIQQQSAQWGDFTATPWPQLLPIRQFVDPNRSGWVLSPGYLKMSLAVFGLVWGFYCPRLRWMTLFLAMFTALGFLLAMGPNFHCGDWTPYDWLRLHYPGLKFARNVFRFVVFAQIGIVLLAAIGLEGLWDLAQRRRKPADETEAIPTQGRLQKRFFLLMGLSFLAIIEVWPAPPQIFWLPDYKKERGWMNWVEQHTQPDDPLACIPFPIGRYADSYFGTTVWMYYGLEHQRPLLNGYSGFFPDEFLDLKQAMTTFPDARSLKLLEENEAKYCIVFRGSFPREKLEKHPLAAKRLKWRFGDDRAEIDIYELLPSTTLK